VTASQPGEPAQGSDLAELVELAAVQLDALAESADKDIAAGNLQTYMSHIATYHGILHTLHQHGICPDFRPMSSYLGSPSLVSHPDTGMKSDLGRVSANAKRLARTLQVKSRSSMHAGQDPLRRALRICERFHAAARQLKTRKRNRPPLLIEDEYDLQYALLAMLRLEFDDVRPEESTPSYAGSGSRMDILLKDEQIVVETKYVTDRLGDKEIGKQLIEDIAHYGAHSDCKTLVCFVYDPSALLENPAGLTSDLEKTPAKMKVRVLVGW